MVAEIKLVDLGRGLQLSTSRITVLDLVPYFQRDCSDEEIKRWLPTLTSAEIALVRAHYDENQAEWNERDRRAREYREEQIRHQAAQHPQPNCTEEDRRSRLNRLLKHYREESIR